MKKMMMVLIMILCVVMMSGCGEQMEEESINMDLPKDIYELVQELQAYENEEGTGTIVSAEYNGTTESWWITWEYHKKPED